MSKSAAVFIRLRALFWFSSRTRFGLGDLEVRYRSLEFLRELRDLADRHGGLLRALGSLLRHREDVLHRGRDVAGGLRLRLRGHRDLLDQLGEATRNLADLRERLAGGIRQLRALDHA